ncbi:unnamed protein product [Psylliodes chrysocephalus]|uniref:Uncharacterized protein n=1 Tax=Psylliodes chrysocephalus TaxID=3402493 RepID=A0A9P0CW39_9CUCU|nr:unnamed protein product [Psylliodes chrysocephala]
MAEVKNKIKNLRSTHVQVVVKIKKSESSGAGAVEIYRPKMKWFSVLYTFLQKMDKKRETISNFVTICEEYGSVNGCEHNIRNTETEDFAHESDFNGADFPSNRFVKNIKNKIDDTGDAIPRVTESKVLDFNDLYKLLAPCNPAFTQLCNMNENDMEQLASFMGHTLGIHRSSYRLPDDIYQIAKISKLLILMKKGEAGQFKGKTLD